VVEFIKHMNTSHNCNRFTQKFASVCDPQPDPEIMSSLKKELKVNNAFWSCYDGTYTGGSKGEACQNP